MKLPKIEEWGEHYPCMSYETLRIPFEDWMKLHYSSPNLEWNSLYNFYQDPKIELRFQGFCEGVLFMEYYKNA